MTSWQHTTRVPTTTVIIMLCVIFVTFAAQALDEARHADARRLICARPTEVMHVCEGDTIWGIASAHRIDGVSTSDLVQWLQEQNNLSTSCLLPGQALLVPVNTTETSLS